jgi:hypothetical protein
LLNCAYSPLNQVFSHLSHHLSIHQPICSPKPALNSNNICNLNFSGHQFETTGQILVTKFEFGGSFGTSLEVDCHEVEVKPNLELLATFGMSLQRVCHNLCTQFHYKLTSNKEEASCDQKFLEIKVF